MKEEKISPKDVDMSGFKIQDELNQDIWDGDKMKPEIRKKLSRIAMDFFNGLDIDSDIEDITMTGSLANYNWSKHSDIDVHIIVEYKDLGDDVEFIGQALMALSDEWNDKHDITMYEFDVEVFLQDKDAKHYSTGVYSIMDDEWVIKPEKKDMSINSDSVINKSVSFTNRVEDLYDEMHDTGDYEDVLEKARNLKDKIKKMRKCGLDAGGEFSVENIVFKVLRRNGTIERLNDLKAVAYDKLMSIE